MAQTTNSQPTNPVITFTVNLATNNWLSPNQYQGSPDLGRSYDTAQVNTRSTFIPGLLDGENVALKHGDTFTLYGDKAQYYRAMIAKGYFPELTITSVS